MSNLTIMKLPSELDLNEREIEAIYEAIGVAEDFAMRGGKNAALALVWLRGLVDSQGVVKRVQPPEVVAWAARQMSDRESN